MAASHDPYSLVRSEVEGSLQSAASLFASFKRIAATLPGDRHDSSEELQWSRDELRANLSALEADVDELEMSVDVVARDPRFGVGELELESRRAFVRRVRGVYACVGQCMCVCVSASCGS